MLKSESRWRGTIIVDFFDTGDITTLQIVKGWHYDKQEPVWLGARIELRLDILAADSIPALQEKLAEVEAEARRLDEEYPPGTPVEPNPADAA